MATNDQSPHNVVRVALITLDCDISGPDDGNDTLTLSRMGLEEDALDDLLQYIDAELSVRPQGISIETRFGELVKMVEELVSSD